MTTYTVQMNPTLSLPSFHERAAVAINHVAAMDRLLDISLSRGETEDALSERLNRDIAEIGRLHFSCRKKLVDLALKEHFQIEDPDWTVERLERLFSLLSPEDFSSLDKIRAETEYKIQLLRKEVLLDPFYKKPLNKPVLESAGSFWPWEEQELIHYIQISLRPGDPDDQTVLSPYDARSIEFDWIQMEGGRFTVKLREANRHLYGQEVLNWFNEFYPQTAAESSPSAESSLVPTYPSEDRQALGFQIYMYGIMAKNVQKIRNERVRGWVAENLAQTILKLKEELEQVTQELAEEFTRQVEEETQSLEKKLAETEERSNRNNEELLARQETIQKELTGVQQFSEELRKFCAELEKTNRALEEGNRRDREEMQRLRQQVSDGGKKKSCVIL